MSFERNKDDNINNNNFISITSKVVKISDAKTDERLHQLLKEYAKLVTVRTHPHKFKEIEQYFFKQCDALPLALNDDRLSLFKADVIMRHFKDKEHKAPRFSDMTDEEITKWHKEKSDLFLEAQCAHPQQFGLNIHGYYLPHTERNKVFYDDPYQGSDICFFFEETTEEYYFTCVECNLMYQVIIFIGISENDIKKHNQHFVTYINAMVEMGYLPKLY
ncbi:hypothetical protein HBE96_13085 [Clostridium sp. P21]|uniref:Uncharacterized protein n=1 Tax=Clostridium muellerianum TaxID=2716538 RepID=A0A7Y0EHP1_9CLOT|nr:hypothetical protein [Clostridium muellerianum]NMM63591.1 hypothetical protein [Clostridium muellerianum]